MIGFSYYNVQFRKNNLENCVAVVGEITNESSRDYDAAVFRLSLFDRQQLIASGMIRIKGFGKKRTKSFEVLLKELPFHLMPKKYRFDINFESGY